MALHFNDANKGFILKTEYLKQGTSIKAGNQIINNADNYADEMTQAFNNLVDKEFGIEKKPTSTALSVNESFQNASEKKAQQGKEVDFLMTGNAFFGTINNLSSGLVGREKAMFEKQAVDANGDGKFDQADINQISRGDGIIDFNDMKAHLAPLAQKNGISGNEVSIALRGQSYMNQDGSFDENNFTSVKNKTAANPAPVLHEAKTDVRDTTPKPTVQPQVPEFTSKTKSVVKNEDAKVLIPEEVTDHKKAKTPENFWQNLIFGGGKTVDPSPTQPQDSEIAPKTKTVVKNEDAKVLIPEQVTEQEPKKDSWFIAGLKSITGTGKTASSVKANSVLRDNGIKGVATDNTLRKTASDSEPKSYDIKKGDNLWNIAKNQYGLTSPKEILEKIAEIKAFNNENGGNEIKNVDLIYAGAKLLLPPKN